MATATPAQVTPERIMQMAWGYVPPLVLEAAIRHHVFDVLDSGPKDIWEVQKATGASARGLTAIMDALVGLNFLSKDEQNRFSLTPESSTFLVSTKPSFFGGMIKHCSEQLIPRWLNLNEVVATGKPVTPGQRREVGRRILPRIRPRHLPHELRRRPGSRRAYELRHLRRPGPRSRSRCRLRCLGHRSGAKLSARPRHRRRLARSHRRHEENRGPLRPLRPLLLHRGRSPRRLVRIRPQRRHPRPHPAQRRRSPQPQAPRENLRRALPAAAPSRFRNSSSTRSAPVPSTACSSPST